MKLTLHLNIQVSKWRVFSAKNCRKNSFQRIKINNSDQLLVVETPWTFRSGQCAHFPLGRSHSSPIFLSLNLSGNELSVRKENVGSAGDSSLKFRGTLLGITIPLLRFYLFWPFWRWFFCVCVFFFFPQMIFWYQHRVCSFHTNMISLPALDKFKRTQLISC